MLGLLVLTIVRSSETSPSTNSEALIPDATSNDTTASKPNEPKQKNNGNIENVTEDLSKPENILKPNTDYSVVLKTNQGDITIDLFEDKKPITVNNFVSLASKKFYDGIIFHRVIKDFMIQGGDPTGTGRGGPGYNFEDEFGQDDAPLVQGSLAMANAGPNTNGSQFFIVTAQSTPWLDGKHTNFGQVTKGLDVVLKIQGLATNAMDKPLEDVVIESVEIVETPKTATQ
ncbi:peptidylprolyl isomerase [candidate division WWE3 bacterium]|uniref:Peptidyl-prolyl cis-trans isomerase n=1 Tax=candidate division WWE3 bacterium TaxID=2053526 RepID=A0A955EBC0_UNCKA|nr:peptidylprolyl isomerase [candidate division WWE3 bacterium]